MAGTDTATEEISAPLASGGGMAGRFSNLGRHTDVALALGIASILLVLILPMPRWLLDVALAISITLSVLIMMTALFIQRPLDFSSFPTVLLIATVLRLSLNLASTRLILSHGHEGPAAAGRVIEAFGSFVMSGNFVIGIIVFAILVTVNFVVITKGSGRIAEVSARFSLDAMPGKQMAIDADLSSGLITEDEARERRSTLENESTFFGSMDGAAKFVRGDAIAGLIITFINVVAGVIIGVAQMGLTLSEAAESYTLLTVGDGLVTQVPALIVSMAAGLLVSKSGITGSADKAVFGQLGGYPKALLLCSFLTGCIGLLPGMPLTPFLLMSGGAGLFGWRLHRSRAATAVAEAEAVEVATQAEAVAEEEPVSTALHIDEIRLELGYGLLTLINDDRGQKLTDQIRALRRQLAAEMGFVMPAVRIQDNMQLPANTYVLRIKEIEAGRGDLRPTMLMVMDPRGDKIGLPGEETTEPTFGLPAVWVEETHREEALFRGYTVVDPATVITTHITEVIRENMSEMLSYAETQKLLDELNDEQKKLIEDMVPSQINIGSIQRVLQNLLLERISIRDLSTVLEAVSEASAASRSITLITEHVRSRLARQISDANTAENGYIPMLSLSPQWEENFAEAITGAGEERQLAMAPNRLQEFIGTLNAAVEQQAMAGESAILVTSPGIRPFVRSIVERVRPHTVVLSQNEIHPRAQIRTLGQI